MRILYLTQWFDPEPAFKGADFAAALVAAGHSVDVATAFPNYPGGKLYPGYRLRPLTTDNVAGLPVFRLWVYPSHDRSLLGRAANYLSFFLSALLFGLFRGDRYDVVYVYHPPLTPGIAAALFCALHRKPMVIDIQDLWPDSVTASGIIDGRITRIIGTLCHYVYRRATRIIVQSEGMLARLHERGVPVEKMTRIYNWSTYKSSGNPPGQDMLPTALEKRFRGHVNLVYGGNMGQAQALEHVVDAAILARTDCPALRLHIFGDGIERDRIAQRAARDSGETVVLYGSVPREVMDRVFDKADILIIHLKQDALYELTIPSKLQHYLSCGKPVVAGLAGEARALLCASRAGIVCAPEDSSGMAKAILAYAALNDEERMAIGGKGRDYYEHTLGFGRAIEQTLVMLEDAVRAGSAR